MQRRRRQIPRSRRRVAAGALVLGLLAPLVAEAAPPADDWSLERDARSPELVEQRFAKLRKSPFDAAQWRALEKALGRGGLERKIEAASKRSPDDVALTILSARVRLAEKDPRAAAALLDAVRERAGPWRGRVSELHVEALLAAGDVRQAIQRIEADARGDRKALLRAHALAEREQLGADAHRLARALATDAPADQLRLARAAVGVNDQGSAETAFAAAERGAAPRERPAIRREWAQARLRAGNPSAAAEIVWRAIDETSAPAEREALWATLADCHGRDVGGALDLERLTTWLADPRHRRDAAAWRTLARLQALQGRDAIASWREAVAADPRDRESQAALILAIEASGDSEGAVAELRRLGGTRSPEHAQLALEIAGRLIANGHRDLGLGLAGEVEASAGRSTATLLALLDFFNLNDEAEHALEIARRLVKLHPRDPEARIALGEQLYQMRRESEALAEWSSLPKLIRPAHRGWARHAEILAEHRHPDAILSLQKALAAAPNEPSYLRLRAILEQESRVPQRALTSWEEILKSADRPEHRLLRDEARTRVVDLLVSSSSGRVTSRRHEAERKALDTLAGKDGATDAERREAGLFLAELYARLDRYEDAVRIHQRLLELSPGDPERLAALALAQRRAGQSEAAMATLERLVEVDPKRSSDVLAELAELAFDAGDLDRALATATRAAAGGADSSRAIVRLGELYERRGDPEAAARTYKRALEVAPGDPLARLRLAELALARGATDEAAGIFRQIVESGAPPEISQQAGRRALDLAEASANTLAIVELALLKAQRDPTSEEPRELLLDALDRSRTDQLQAWLKADPKEGRSAALRRVLVFSLNRDPVGTRLRAAEHLGKLQLPGSAVPLARTGAQLTPPRDAPRPVKEAYAQARAAALLAAGALKDREALPIFEQVGRNPGSPADVRYAAAWATLHTAERADSALLGFLGVSGDAVLASLACLAIAERPALAASPEVRRELQKRSDRARNEQQRHACAAAIASITPESEPARLLAQLSASDPMQAAIAAWRLGRSERPSPEVLEALLRRFLGPRGLARDASAAALARHLGGAEEEAPPPLPHFTQRGWEAAVSRWLILRTAPPYRPLRPQDLAPAEEPLRRALAAAADGTRAEREALREAMEGCPGAAGEGLCLAPLVRGPVDLDGLAGGRRRKAR
ncbi:MAG: tetratricopeptide repeat protein [Myxococcales bacterium]|nr:tetratricopeptide repeat protein [Myxococcales bacterium]